MTDEAPIRRRPNVADIYRGAVSPARTPSAAATRKLQPLKALKSVDTAKSESQPPTSSETPKQSTAGERSPARRSQRNPHAGRPAVSVRMPETLLERFDATCAETGMTPLELTLTAVATALPELPVHIAEDNAAKQAPAARPAPSTHSIGGLFELPSRHSATHSAPATVQRIWRTTQQNMDSIDQLVQQVGARDRQQLLLLSLTHYLEQKEP